MVIRVFDFEKTGRKDSDTIAHCLSLLNTSEPNTVIFDQKTWIIDSAILIPSNTTVIIDDCTIKQADYTYDNIFRGDNLTFGDDIFFPVNASPLSNVKIIGKGNAKLEGPDVNRRMFHPVLQEEQDMVGDFYGFRTHQISFSMISGCEITGLSIVKTRGWAICFDLSNNIHIADIYFDSNVKNGDGIDFRSGTHNCTVERISGRTSDDTIACTALASNAPKTYPIKNYLYPSQPGLYTLPNKNQDELDVHDIVIRDVNTSGKHHGLICLAANGCRVYNVQIENIREPGDEWREATVKIYTGYGTGYTPGDIHDICVKDVYASYANHAVYCNAQVENVVLENIHHIHPEQRLKLDYPENIEVR